jgi:ligand-binding sensor domain-containing protein
MIAMKTINLLLCSLALSVALVICAYGQGMSYREFVSVELGVEASTVNCFTQDYQGLLWIGSNRGLYSYDGFSVQAHVSFETCTQVYCLLILDETYLCLGTDNGVFFYNYRTDQYETIAVDFPADVRAMLLCDSLLWIGSLNGLYWYDVRQQTLERVQIRGGTGLSHETVYAIERVGQTVYVGTYNGLCMYKESERRFEKINLPLDSKRSNLFVNALLYDTMQHCLWIGTEGMLYKYTLEKQQNQINKQNGRQRSSSLSLGVGIAKVKQFENHSVKSLAIDYDQNLLVGTDNGLYVYTEKNNSVQHVVHDAKMISHWQTISYGVYLKIKKIISGLVRTLIFLWLHIVKCFNLFLFHKLRDPETGIGFMHSLEIQEEISGWVVPMD